MDRGCFTYVVSGEMMDRGLGQHAVVLEFGLAERRGVAGDDDQLGLSRTKALQGRLVTQSNSVQDKVSWSGHWTYEVLEGRGQNVLSRLHDQSQTAVDRVRGLLSFLGGHLCASGKYRKYSCCEVVALR